MLKAECGLTASHYPLATIHCFFEVSMKIKRYERQRGALGKTAAFQDVLEKKGVSCFE